MDILRPIQRSPPILIVLPEFPNSLVQCQRNSPIVGSSGSISKKLGVERLRNLDAHLVTGRPQAPCHMPKPGNSTSTDDVKDSIHQACSSILGSRTGRQVRICAPERWA
ncbi:hypothetical protein GJ744_005043 [Endocarpon pusillum]|uniref:Uncharacterized protein n=1 Tax=Endocarpon pusillum TaxID=364733 RepID=A0A8H7A903_9EURO|nr:hypothetical protein GJ744_005043 [Endocarpon pusillum]